MAQHAGTLDHFVAIDRREVSPRPCCKRTSVRHKTLLFDSCLGTGACENELVLLRIAAEHAGLSLRVAEVPRCRGSLRP